MKPSPYSKDREKIVADAIWPIATELRMIEVADLVAMLRFERHAELADIVTSAAELYFLPGTVGLGNGGDYRLDWSGGAQVVLDLEIRPSGVTIYARLTLEDESAGIEIDHIVFHSPDEDPAINTAMLTESLATVAYRPFPQACALAERPAA